MDEKEIRFRRMNIEQELQHLNGVRALNVQEEERLIQKRNELLKEYRALPEIITNAGKVVLSTQVTMSDETVSWMLKKVAGKWTVSYHGQRSLYDASLDNAENPTMIFYYMRDSDTYGKTVKYFKTLVIDPPPPAPKPVEPKPEPQVTSVFCSKCGAMNNAVMQRCRVCGNPLLGPEPEQPKKTLLEKVKGVLEK